MRMPYSPHHHTDRTDPTILTVLAMLIILYLPPDFSAYRHAASWLISIGALLLPLTNLYFLGRALEAFSASKVRVGSRLVGTVVIGSIVTVIGSPLTVAVISSTVSAIRASIGSHSW